MKFAAVSLVLGFVLVVAGAACVYRPAGLLAAGIGLVSAGFLAAKRAGK